MSIRKFLIYFFVCCLIFWLGASLVRTLYNVSKLPEDLKVFQLSEDSRRLLTYGKSYSFCKFAAKNTSPNSSILFLSSGGKLFYLCRYILFPRKLFYLTDPDEIKIEKEKSKYEYILIYQSADPLLNENKSERWNLKTFKFDKIFQDSGAKGGVVTL